MQGKRGQYTAAGSAARDIARQYEARREARVSQLYIADVPAGSRQDELRDFNRPGYRVSRPWNDVEVPLFVSGTEAAIEQGAVQPRKSAKQKQTFVERMIDHAKRDRQGALLCGVLLLTILILLAAMGQKQVELRSVRLRIEAYNSETVALEQQSEVLAQQIALAKKDERIRNLAQNQLNMLRPERAETQTIYIQTNDKRQTETIQQTQEHGMELLDILLGLLDVFHIGE